jgi:hypothetical protein
MATLGTVLAVVGGLVVAGASYVGAAGLADDIARFASDNPANYLTVKFTKGFAISLHYSR